MKVTFILTEPATPENVGAAARAMKTMGFSDLRLVNPCDHLSNEARWLAHASQEILENATLYSTLEDTLSGIDFAVGTTAKKRSVKNDYHPLNSLPQILASKGNSIQHLAVIFGREESGLTNEELKLCDLVTTVPLNTSYPSLNLAQAVMLYAYELSGIHSNEEVKAGKKEQGYLLLKDKAKQTLEKAGFEQESNIYNRFLERMALLEEGDIHLLHSFLNKITGKLK